MARTKSKALQPRKKTEVTTRAEQTTPGPTFSPAVDIFETDREITLLADMPGVKAKDLTVDLRDNVLTLNGEVESLEDPNEVDVFREYQTGRYLREFNLSEVIDQSKIQAELKDGVLRLTLPKVETATPRKVIIKTE
jgi:HSP20 family protein